MEHAWSITHMCERRKLNDRKHTTPFPVVRGEFNVTSPVKPLPLTPIAQIGMSTSLHKCHFTPFPLTRQEGKGLILNYTSHALFTYGWIKRLTSIWKGSVVVSG